MANLPKHPGTFIRPYLLQIGENVTGFARKIHMSQSHIRMITLGQRDISAPTAVAIASFFEKRFVAPEDGHEPKDPFWWARMQAEYSVTMELQRQLVKGRQRRR